jgi:hypothetical protein
MNRKEKKSDICRALIYSCVFAVFIIKMNFYSNHLGEFNDELAHISYVAHLESFGGVVPEFENMKILVNEATNRSKNRNLLEKFSSGYFSEENVNYLGHPPLYYYVMRFMGGVRHEGNRVFIDMKRMRINTQILAALGLLLAFGLGFSKIKKIIPTVLYAVILTSVPMFSAGSAGINNDTMSYLVMTIFVIGIIRFCDNKRDYVTYALIAAGITGSGLTKLTAFLLTLVAALVVVAFTIYREKKVTAVFNKKFWRTAVIYLPVIIYYVIMLSRYGSVRFSPESSGFARNEDSGVIGAYGMFGFFFQYVKTYFLTWCNVISNYTVGKTGGFLSLDNIALMMTHMLPFIVIFFMKKQKEQRLSRGAVLISYLVVSGINYISCYKEYISSGYFGGMHSRYYYCIIPVFALLLCERYDESRLVALADRFGYTNRKTVECFYNVMWIGFTFLLLYEDFFAFLRVNYLYY